METYVKIFQSNMYLSRSTSVKQRKSEEVIITIYNNNMNNFHNDASTIEADTTVYSFR